MAKKKKQFRSGLERNTAARLRKHDLEYSFEPFKIRFTQPAKKRLYLPDFVFKNGIIVECKGKWDTPDRHKMKFVQADWPDLDIRFVFSNAKAKIRKGSKTTVAAYAEKNGWLWAHRNIPLSWVREEPNERSIAAIQEILKDPINRK